MTEIINCVKLILEKPNLERTVLLKNQTILVFRHGYTRYRQGNGPCDLNNAADLAMPAEDKDAETEDEFERRILEAIVALKVNVWKASRYLDVELDTEIISSLTGRGLHSAEVIRQALTKIPRFKAPSIAATHELTEVRNFDWKLFYPLCVGGNVRTNGYWFSIDRELSNPKNLPHGEYFMRDVLHTLPDSVTSNWPQNYVQTIRSFERSVCARERMFRVLKKVTSSDDGKQKILVTHDALCSFMVNIFTGGAITELEKGSYVVLRGDFEGLRVIAAGNLPEGNSETNIFDLLKP